MALKRNPNALSCNKKTRLENNQIFDNLFLLHEFIIIMICKF